MAKLFLKFEAAVLKEVSLTQGVVTIGRLPDNVIQVDNLAVSGHHAKIYWDEDKFIVEDNNSLNGTYLNNRRISKAALKDKDVVLIGKHTIAFQDEWHEGSGAPPAAAEKSGPAAPKLEATMVLDTKKAKEMLAAAQAASSAGAIASTGTVAEAGAAPAAPTPGKDRIGVLTVLDGKTDAPTYRLTSKMTVIGKSDMASIKLKGFFAPNMAALINKRDNKYFIAASEAKIKVKINGAEVAGQKELNEGDVIEVASIKMNISFE
jgi:predicted component of type VI protein secretion system